MSIPEIVKGIERDFSLFEEGLERFGKRISLLAGSSIKEDIGKYRKIERERSTVKLLRNDIAHKRFYSDIDVDGIHHLEAEAGRRERELSKMERELFSGNQFVRSAIAFEKDLLKKAGNEARKLHELGSTIQKRIGNLIDFAEKDFKGDSKLDKAHLYRRSLALSEKNINLLQNVMLLSGMNLATSADAEEYLSAKSQVLMEAKNHIELDSDSGAETLAKGIAEHYLADFRRTNAIR